MACTVITFAGRQDRMSLLERYVRECLDLGIVDQWDIWNLARTPEDSVYVDSIQGPNITVRKAESFKDVYEFYAPDPTKNDDVFIKMDDDIVYVDVHGLKHLIEFRKLNRGYYLVSANVANNPTCYLIQKDVGVFGPITEMNLDGSHATKLHHAVLADEQVRFDCVADVSPDVMLPINCVAWLGSDLESVQYCASTTVEDDERNLSHNFPKIFGRPVCVFGPCVACHLSYKTQEPDMPIAELIEGYASFSNHHAMDPFPEL